MHKSDRKFRKSAGRAAAIMLSAVMAFSGSLVYASEDDYVFTKISNPDSGVGEPDGINTNDLTGFEANRLNSYAWAVASRGDYIYIGTNRTLFGSALNAVSETFHANNPNITMESMGNAITVVSGGDVPVNLDEEDYIPQIIKFDTKNGTTEVIYQPGTKRGEDEVLYYTDMDGEIIPNADVASETASFRSVVKFKNNLYYGSLGSNMLQLVRIDEEDNAKVVFQTIGLVSSLRAGCVYDDGDCETVYYGGQDTTYAYWRQYKFTHPDDPSPLPIVIRYLDPDTAGSENEDWSGLVADFDDFGKYSYASVYANGGGNVWDLCSYNGKLYLILAYDGGWALFRGEKGGDNPNKFGWTWTEIVGDNGKYPLAMNEEVAELNEQFRQDYNCTKYAPTLRSAGLLESTATPYVFNGKMYIGSFDNATSIQSESVVKALVKLMMLKNSKNNGPTGPTLEQIFAPIYQVLTHPQHIWVMDENEEITAVESANELLEGTTNDYVWRFIEHDGKLYTGTFDSATAFIYFLDLNLGRILKTMRENKDLLPENVQKLLDGSFSKVLNSLIRESGVEFELAPAAVGAAESVEALLRGEDVVDELLGKIGQLNAIDLEAVEAKATDKISIRSTIEMIRWLRKYIDVEGLRYWSKAKAIAKNSEHGFDILVTEDGENWERINANGFGDPYNYGARTFTICNDELYVGTANPYYGAQLWKISEVEKLPLDVTAEPEAIETPFTGSEIELVTEGECENATFYYALGDNENVAPKFDGLSEDPDKIWSTTVPTATEVGRYYVWYKAYGDEGYENTDPECAISMILFNDVTDGSKYYFKPAYWAAEMGITKGYLSKDGLKRTFEPANECSREEMVTFLWRLAGKPEPELTESPFTDVPASGKYYSQAVLWAYENGITKGYATGDKAGTFGVGETVTREDSVTFLYRLADKPEVSTKTSEFTDVEAGKYYTAPIIWAAENGITKGYATGDKAGTFGVGENCLREQIITFIYRF